MCQALPGPRCASHVRASIHSYQNKLTKLESQLASQMDKYQLNDTSPENQQVRVVMDKLNREYRETHVKLALAQRDYYGTPTGQRELANRFECSTSDIEKETIRREMRNAKLMRSWRKNALDRKRSGLSVNYHDLTLLNPSNSMVA